jgi:putative chitinase
MQSRYPVDAPGSSVDCGGDRVKPLTASRLAEAMGINIGAAELWVQHVNSALALCGCTTPEHVAMWIAQVGHESNGLDRMVESLNYSPEGLLATWPSRYGPSLARSHGRVGDKPADQKAIAINVYGTRLGNWPNTEDGWTFRGRGPIQVTGRANYRECGIEIGSDLERHPELLELRSTGAASTAWYWRKHKLTGYNADVQSVTRKINGGLNGLADRERRFAKAMSVLTGGELVRVS